MTHPKPTQIFHLSGLGVQLGPQRPLFVPMGPRDHVILGGLVPGMEWDVTRSERTRQALEIGLRNIGLRNSVASKREPAVSYAGSYGRDSWRWALLDLELPQPYLGGPNALWGWDSEDPRSPRFAYYLYGASLNATTRRLFLRRK